MPQQHEAVTHQQLVMSDHHISRHMFGRVVSFPLSSERMDKLYNVLAHKETGIMIAVGLLGITGVSAVIIRKRHADAIGKKAAEAASLKQKTGERLDLTPDELESFTGFYESHKERLLKYLRMSVYNPHDEDAATDLCEQIFFTLLRQWPRYCHASPDDLKKLFQLTVRTRRINWYRDHTKQSAHEFIDRVEERYLPTSESAEDTYFREHEDDEPTLQGEAFVRFVEKLGQEKGPLFLLELAGLTHEEIGRVFGRTGSAIKADYRRVCQKLGKALKAEMF